MEERSLRGFFQIKKEGCHFWQPSKVVVNLKLVSDYAEVVAAVLGPSGLVVALHSRIFLAVRNHLELAGSNAQGHEVIVSSLSTTFAEGEVVFLGAAFVAVAFDTDLDGVVLLHQVILGLQDVLVLGFDAELIKREEHAAVSDLLDSSLHFGGNAVAVVSVAGFGSLFLGATKASSKSHNQSKN